MKLISWQFVVIIAIVAGCITTLELYALSQSINGLVLSTTIGLLVAIPSVIITRKVVQKKVK